MQPIELSGKNNKEITNSDLLNNLNDKSSHTNSEHYFDSYQGEIVASILYINGKRDRWIDVNQISSIMDHNQSLLWIGLKDPCDDLLKKISAQLDWGEKALEEISQKHRRPKVISYEKMVLVVAITVEIELERPIFGEMQVLIGENFLLTIRRGATATNSELRERLEASPKLLEYGSDFVAAELLDLLVDRYVLAASKLESLVENAEQKLLMRGQKDADVRKIYRHRRDLLRIHTAIAPLTEICRRLARVEVSVIDTQAQPYFTEVADRVSRVDELINSLREALAFAFEASLMISQSQQNDTTRKLAAWAAILAVPTAIAGIYGMNFELMPELKFRWGYPIVMIAIGSLCGSLYWRFRRIGWL